MSKEVMFYAQVSLGYRSSRRIMYLKSIEWVGDQIVFSFSEDKCEVPASFLSALTETVSAAKKCPSMQWCVTTEEVPGSRDEVEKYRLTGVIKTYVEKFGFDSLVELVANSRLNNLLQEVSSDE